MSRHQKDKNQEGKTNLDLLEQEIVSGSGICWAICNAYSLRPPARSPPAGDTWVHLNPMVHTRGVPPCMAQSRLGACDLLINAVIIYLGVRYLWGMGDSATMAKAVQLRNNGNIMMETMHYAVSISIAVSCQLSYVSVVCCYSSFYA